MTLQDQRRKHKYDLLRKNGFNSYEATKYKNLSYKKVLALIETRREVLKVKEKSLKKEKEIWQQKR